MFFQKDMAMRILHLSDIHFGMNTSSTPISAHRWIDKDGKPDPGQLASILQNNQNLKDKIPSVIVISGDVGWSGGAEDYEYAKKFFASLSKMWDAAKLIIVPGNHDVNTGVTIEDDKRQEDFIKFLQDFHGESFASDFPLYSLPNNSDHYPGHRHLLVSIWNNDNFLIVGINSAASIAKNNTDAKNIDTEDEAIIRKRPIYIHPFTLEHLEKHLKERSISDSALRVLVLHHHLLPFIQAPWEKVIDPAKVNDKVDRTTVANSAKLQEWLGEHGFHLVLHGHKHTFHARHDTLWRTQLGTREKNASNPLMIIGAGSAGVYQQERTHGEPLNFNIIDFDRLANQHWQMNVLTECVDDTTAISTKTNHFYSFKEKIGCHGSNYPEVFYAADMATCHQAIANACNNKKVYRNFISIVEQCKYDHPDTVRIGRNKPSKDDVVRSFLTLHPEYSKERKWEPTHLKERLPQIALKAQYQYGLRIFGIYGQAGKMVPYESPENWQPFAAAIEELKRGRNSRGYIGIYNPLLDVKKTMEPLPGLVGLQFILSEKDSGLLDAVAIFRKIELSFWWVVNMFEVIELLQYAATEVDKDPGQITFFSPIGEWKHDPKPTFGSKLDNLSLADLMQFVISIQRKKIEYIAVLKQQLSDKIKETNENNIEISGLERLQDLLAGLMRVDDDELLKNLQGCFSTAVNQMKCALNTPDKNTLRRSLSESRNQLQRAITTLDSLDSI